MEALVGLVESLVGWLAMLGSLRYVRPACGDKLFCSCGVSGNLGIFSLVAAGSPELLLTRNPLRDLGQHCRLFQFQLSDYWVTAGRCADCGGEGAGAGSVHKQVGCFGGRSVS